MRAAAMVVVLLVAGCASAPDAGTESATGGGDAVASLMVDAAEARRAGELERAAAILERALRLDSRNGRLWHELAAIRLEQGNGLLAVSLARKSNTLAAGDPALQRDNAALIERARGAP